MASDETAKARQQVMEAHSVMLEANKRRRLAKKIMDKAENEARYYKELARALAKQRKAAEDAAGGIESAKQARMKKEEATKKAYLGQGARNDAKALFVERLT